MTNELHNISKSNSELFWISSNSSDNIINSLIKLNDSGSSTEGQKQNNKNGLFNLEDIRVLAKLLDDEKKKVDLTIDLECETMNKILVYDFSDEIDFVIYEKLNRIYQSYGKDSLGKIIQKLAYDNLRRPKVVEKLCSYLERLDFEEVNPWGGFFVGTLINNNNKIIKECAINLIDNWKDKSMLPLLYSTNVEPLWMKKYIESIIKSIEAL